MSAQKEKVFCKGCDYYNDFSFDDTDRYTHCKETCSHPKNARFSATHTLPELCSTCNKNNDCELHTKSITKKTNGGCLSVVLVGAFIFLFFYFISIIF
jgi:hypothetical protein